MKLSQWQLEDIPLQINTVQMHFRIKSVKKSIPRSRSATKEKKKEASTCVSPKSLQDEILKSYMSDGFLQQENSKAFATEVSILEMPSHLEESPRKAKFSNVLKSSNQKQETKIKAKKRSCVELCRNVSLRSTSSIVHHNSTPKSKRNSIRSVKMSK